MIDQTHSDLCQEGVGMKRKSSAWVNVVSLISQGMVTFSYSPPSRPSVTLTANSQILCQSKICLPCTLLGLLTTRGESRDMALQIGMSFYFPTSGTLFASCTVSLFFAWLSSSGPAGSTCSVVASFPALPV